MKRAGRCDTCLVRKPVRVLDLGGGFYRVLCEDCRTVDLFGGSMSTAARSSAPLVLEHQDAEPARQLEPDSLDLFRVDADKMGAQ